MKHSLSLSLCGFLAKGPCYNQRETGCADFITDLPSGDVIFLLVPLYKGVFGGGSVRILDEKRQNSLHCLSHWPG